MGAFLPKGFEWVIILIVVLLIFGPKNLPKLGNAIGKTVSSLRSGMNDGKKKKGADAAKAEGDEAAGEAAAKPAAIEGEVEAVEDVEEVEEAAPAAEAEEAPAEAPKKVKRVVKKKVASEEAEPVE